MRGEAILKIPGLLCETGILLVTFLSSCDTIKGII
jgi:hypothetical protein